MERSLIYIASPYSHPEQETRDFRVRAAAAYAARLFKMNVPCYSPVAHWAPIEREFNLPQDQAAYVKQNEAVLAFSRMMHVLQLPGWAESQGVHREITFCIDNGIPITYIEG